MKIGALRNAGTMRVVVPRLMVPVGWLERGIGLLGHSQLEAGSAMWIKPCSAIHTMGMRFAIDLVFLDRSGTVLRTTSHVRPWRMAGPVRGAHAVLELPSGAVRQLSIEIGHQYIVE